MKFNLRPWSPSDIDALVEYANNFNIAKYMKNVFPSPYTKQDGKNFIEMVSKDKPIKVFAIIINEKACGGIGIFQKEDIMCKNAEIGYWLAEQYWGKGIITNAIKEMVDYGFKTFDINRIYAVPFGTNISSQKALENAGFILEGKFEKTIFKNGEYHDELIYAIRK